MADADVAITAGAGTKVDTRTVGAGTDEHRQVIVVGDPNNAVDVAVVRTPADGMSQQDGLEVNATIIGFDGTNEQLIRARTVPTNGSGVTALAVDPNARQLATYTAVVNRVASGALTANTTRAIISIEHAASATKTVKVRRILIHGYATTATAGTVEWQVFRGTAASSAGTAITPQPTMPGTAAAETTVKSIPTMTAATQLIAGVGGNVPATANSAVPQLALYDWQEGGETQALTLRAGFLDTLSINIISTAAINFTTNAYVVFTEE